MLNKDTQNKLYNEIAEMELSLNGKRINYEKVQKLEYLNQLASETLRKWPPPFSDRACCKNFQFGDEDGTTIFKIEEGLVTFSIKICKIEINQIIN